MYRVEMIPKTSVMDDIMTHWVNSGRKDTLADGEFVFECTDRVMREDGVLVLQVGEKTYIYNVADFYRIKVIEIEGDLFSG